MGFHPEVESYLVIQSLMKDKTKVIQNKGKDYVASNIDSIMLFKKAVIISNSSFCLHVHGRYLKQIIKLLKQAGVKQEDITHFDNGACEKVYVIQDPDIFIPHLMKFEELLNRKR